MFRFLQSVAVLQVALALAAPVALAQTADVPPTEGASLLKWLQAGNYRRWPKESAPHRSMGPHQTLVVTHLNPALDKSLTAKASSHPQGAAAVKELLDSGGKVSGWAVSVKTSAGSDDGKGWYWYEIMGNTSRGNVVAQDNGAPLCSGCHASSKRDFVLIPHPLD